MKIEELKENKIAILGFGEEGKSTLRFLIGIGAKDITILDKNFINIDSEKYPHVLEISGDFYLDNLDSFDTIIKSPGISPYNSKISPVINKLTSQAEIFFSNYTGKVIGVTATKGKTTTVSILSETLINSGYKTKLVGNIGNPVLDEVDVNIKNEYDYIIYELSSYMLEGFTPYLYIGVLGNIFPDHVDWHNNSLKIYSQAKENILINAKYALDGREILKNPENLLKNINTPLLGEHNIKNISLVWEVCKIIGVNKNILLNTVRTFKAISHRLEKIAEKKGIIFVDDSISTTPESTIEGVKTFGTKIGTIFLGGLDRGGYCFKGLVSCLEKYNIRNIVLFPETGFIIKDLLKDPQYNILETSCMKEAIIFAFSNCKKGEICLLSTASPSYNLYKNYIEQGNDFKTQIDNY